MMSRRRCRLRLRRRRRRASRAACRRSQARRITMEQELETPQDGAAEHGPEVIVRTFAAEMTAGDGRTVDVRIVPYGERITHNDGLGGVPKGVPYTEEWVPGAFADQARAAEVGRAKHVL